MRARFVSRLQWLTVLICACLGVAGGCNSTPSLPSSLQGKSSIDPAPNMPSHAAGDVNWKKAPNTFSTALTQDSWTNPARSGDPIQATAFQTESKVDVPPIPEVMIKDRTEPRTVQAQPASLYRGPKHQGSAPPMMMTPNAPTEYGLVALPTYTIRPPDVLLIESQKGLLTQPIRGQHLVRVDGTVGLGIYGPAAVAGRTIQQAREEIARVIHGRLDQKTVKFEDVLDGLSVDVLAYNSSVYYVITDGAGLGEQVYRFPVTGSETVLDAISNINGLPVVACPKRIWVARRNVGQPGPENVLPVDWKGITQQGAMNTNWQIMPGDRVYVQADPMRRFNNNLSKFLEPIDRIFGASLLGAQTVNTIKGVNNGVVR